MLSSQKIEIFLTQRWWVVIYFITEGIGCTEKFRHPNKQSGLDLQEVYTITAYTYEESESFLLCR